MVSLYHECAKIHLFAPTVRQMRMWEVAAALGVGFDEPSTTAAGERESAVPGVSQSDYDLLQARVRAAAGEGPEPQPIATNADQVSAMMNMFNMPNG